MLQFITENKGKILIGLASGIAVGGALYYFFSKPKETPTPNSQVKEKVLTFQKKYAIIMNKIQQLFDKQEVVGLLPPEIVFEIYRGHYYLAEEEARKEMLRGRQERRKVLDDRREHARAVAKSDKQLEDILQKHLSAILARFSIERTQWTNSINALCSEEDNNDEWEEMVRVEDEKLLTGLTSPTLKLKPYSEIKKILEFQVKKLEQIEVEEMALDVGVDENAKFNIVEAYIRDLVHAEFDVEEELLSYSVSKLKETQKQSLEKYYNDISTLIGNLIFDDVDPEGEKYDQSPYM